MNHIYLFIFILAIATPANAQADSFPTFPADRYREFQIDPSFIHQFLAARCATSSQHQATTGLYRFYALNDHYPTMTMLPFSIFFQPDRQDKIYHLSKGFCRGHHITVPVKYHGTYYVTINDAEKPAILIIRTNTPELTTEFRAACAIHQGFNIPYLNQSSPSPPPTPAATAPGGYSFLPHPIAARAQTQLP